MLKTTSIALKILKLHPETAINLPIKQLDNVVRISTDFIYLGYTFNPLNYFINKKKNSLKDVCLNTAFLALSVLNIINWMKLFKVAPKFIDETFNKVPFLKALPYSGLVDVLTITVCTISIFKEKEEKDLSFKEMFSGTTTQDYKRHFKIAALASKIAQCALAIIAVGSGIGLAPVAGYITLLKVTEINLELLGKVVNMALKNKSAKDTVLVA